MLFVPARWFHVGRTKPIRLIVIHETISQEMGTGAEAVAAYFKRGERRGSTQRVADNNSTVQCVRDTDTCFGAAGANSDGLHLELVGPGNQPGNVPGKGWDDPYSVATIGEGGKTVREWSHTHDIPLRWLTVAQVADGKSRGLCTHDDVSRAFPAVSTGHSDPQNFPKAAALRVWSPQPEPPLGQEDDDMQPHFITVDNNGVKDAHGAFLLPDGRLLDKLTDEQKSSLKAVYLTGSANQRQVDVVQSLTA